MPDTTNPIGFTDANELREKNRATVEKYMNTKGQDRLRRHELFVEDGCDPEYPEERQAYMLEDSGVQLLLSQSHLKLPLAQGVQRIDLDRGAPWFEDYSEANPDIYLDGENLAYVIYTSGSTGKPKGAGNRHSALSNRLCWMQQAYGLGVGDTVLQKTPFSFDVSVWEFFWPLMSGPCAAQARPGRRIPPARTPTPAPAPPAPFGCTCRKSLHLQSFATPAVS